MKWTFLAGLPTMACANVYACHVRGFMLSLGGVVWDQQSNCCSRSLVARRRSPLPLATSSQQLRQQPEVWLQTEWIQRNNSETVTNKTYRVVLNRRYLIDAHTLFRCETIHDITQKCNTVDATISIAKMAPRLTLLENNNCGQVNRNVNGEI